MTHRQSILLIRHGEVDPKWKGICYGALDVSLSEHGVATSNRVAAAVLRSFQPTIVYHSGLSRTRLLADRITEVRTDNIVLREDVRLQERNYGAWHGMSWDDAYNSDPDNFHGLIEEPDTYRPPDGETTSEMQRRVVDWLQDQQGHGQDVIAISHSGPIAALAGYALDLKPTEWTPWIVKNLQAVQFKCDESSHWTVQKREIAMTEE